MLFKFHCCVSHDGRRDDAFHGHPNAVGEVVRLVDDDEAVLKRNAHRWQGTFPNLFGEHVVVIAHQNIGFFYR